MDVLRFDDISIAQYWTLLEQVTDGVWKWDIEKNEVQWSPSLFQTLGYPEGERKIQDILAITHPNDRSAHARAIGDHIDYGGAYSVEIRVRTYQGEYLWIQARGMSERNAEGQPTMMLGYILNNSASLRQQEALRLSEARFRAFMDNCPAAVFLKNRDGKHLYVNSAAAELASVTVDDMMGHCNQDIFPKDTADQMDLVDQRVLETGVLEQWTGVVHRADKTQRWVHDVKFPVQLQQGELALGGFGFDLTELRRAQQAANTSHRLESLGRLAGGVAHDFNNMLSVILGYAMLAMDALPEDSQVHEYLKNVINAADRSAEIVRQLLVFARRQTIKATKIDLNESIDDTMKMLRRLIGEDIELVSRKKVGLWPVELDPSQLDQILTNLCINARDAISDVGTVTIETSNVVLDDSYFAKHARYAPGEFVLLAVSDTGCGMDEETLKRLFEPFFTTKDHGKGTGLGLATVYGIVKQSKGFIDVQSEPGAGSTFRLYFPRYLGVGERPKERTVASLRTGKGETILVVEDESALLQLTREMLKGLGYKVLSAGSPTEALHLARTHDGPIQLLVTDVVMPEMNGKTLSVKLQALYPELKVIFMSGYAEDVISDHAVLDEKPPFLQKPFSIANLGTKIRELLA